MLVEVILRSLLLFGQCAYGEMQSANHQKLTSEPIELEPVTGDPAVPPPSKTDIPSDDGSGKKGCLLLWKTSLLCSRLLHFFQEFSVEQAEMQVEDTSDGM